ncbi:MAG: hypothetical protein WB586_19945 [Chthoniobacterales bacterium]
MRLGSTALAGWLIFAGCATHQQPATPPAFAPTSENAVQVLSGVPRGGYDKLGAVTILQDAAVDVDRNFQTVRQIAAQAGANAIFVQQEKAYSFRNGYNRCTRGRIIVYSLVHVR